MTAFLLYLACGALLGLAYLVMLWGAVRLLFSPHGGVLLYAALVPVRLGLLTLGFSVVLRQGTWAGLVALGGFAAIRFLALRGMAPPPWPRLQP
ncbi:MAG: ATP synthase subunit I [Pseudomonadota bacterium]